MLRRFMGRWTAAFAGGSLKKIAAAAALGLAAFGTADQAAAATTFTGQFGDGGTWNVYELINNPFTWEEAWKLAPTRSNPITGNAAVGHLVTLTDLAENNFVHSTAGGGDLWIGLTDRVGISTAMESFNEFDPRNGGWAWVTGEPYTFADPDFPGIMGYWGDLEPNDAGRPASGEDAAHIRGDGRWNDHQSGFDLDEPVAHADNTPEGQQTFRFVIEWDTELASQPAGFPMTRPDPTPPPLPPIPRVFPTPLARLPGPDGTASAWGGMDVLHGAGVGTINETITRVVAGEGTRVEG
ncbi:MAG TPA: lectin-like protein, partial [Lacipirellulaceae bacterium]